MFILALWNSLQWRQLNSFRDIDIKFIFKFPPL